MRKNLDSYCKEEELLYLLEEWNREKNGVLLPKDVSKTSRTVVWWKCSKCGFEWKTQVASRAIGKTHCPECYRRWQNEKLNSKDKK
ncbi:MAG TPA: zinc-ribbon domain-containing protein [Clostridia bacterium]|nr:zinc-ribbon domain-containing protein [Clostridia bacterium]